MKVYCKQIYFATLVKTQNCTKMLTNVTFLYRLHIFTSDQIIEESNNKEFLFLLELLSDFRYKKQLSSNFLGNLEQLVASPR